MSREYIWQNYLKLGDAGATMKAAAIHCLELLNLKNPDKIEDLGNHVYEHTNTRGVKRRLFVYSSYPQYNKHLVEQDKPGDRLHRVQGCYIVERKVLDA